MGTLLKRGLELIELFERFFSRWLWFIPNLHKLLVAQRSLLDLRAKYIE